MVDNAVASRAAAALDSLYGSVNRLYGAVDEGAVNLAGLTSSEVAALEGGARAVTQVLARLATLDQARPDVVTVLVPVLNHTKILCVAVTLSSSDAEVFLGRTPAKDLSLAYSERWIAWPTPDERERLAVEAPAFDQAVSAILEQLEPVIAPLPPGVREFEGEVLSDWRGTRDGIRWTANVTAPGGRSHRTHTGVLSMALLEQIAGTTAATASGGAE